MSCQNVKSPKLHSRSFNINFEKDSSIDEVFLKESSASNPQRRKAESCDISSRALSQNSESPKNMWVMTLSPANQLTIHQAWTIQSPSKPSWAQVSSCTRNRLRLAFSNFRKVWSMGIVYKRESEQRNSSSAKSYSTGAAPLPKIERTLALPLMLQPARHPSSKETVENWSTVVGRKSIKFRKYQLTPPLPVQCFSRRARCHFISYISRSENAYPTYGGYEWSTAYQWTQIEASRKALIHRVSTVSELRAIKSYVTMYTHGKQWCHSIVKMLRGGCLL